MLHILAKFICLIAGHAPQPGYPENYQPPYCGTCGLENPPNNRMHLTAFGVGVLAFLAGFGIGWLVFVR